MLSGELSLLVESMLLDWWHARSSASSKEVRVRELCQAYCRCTSLHGGETCCDRRAVERRDAELNPREEPRKATSLICYSHLKIVFEIALWGSHVTGENRERYEITYVLPCTLPSNSVLHHM
jgi:hypothetical protein